MRLLADVVSLQDIAASPECRDLSLFTARQVGMESGEGVYTRDIGLSVSEPWRAFCKRRNLLRKKRANRFRSCDHARARHCAEWLVRPTRTAHNLEGQIGVPRLAPPVG